MFRNDLYTLLENRAEVAGVCFRIRLNAEHPLFKGHFPAQPVLPGVCTLSIVRECLADIVACPVRFTEIRECKFTAAVDPRTTPELEIRLTAANGALQSSVTDGERTILKLKAQYAPLDD